MLQIVVPEGELFDNSTQEFIKIKGQVLSLEHSLVSISKWEFKYKKPFLPTNKQDVKTTEEILYYIKCMTLTQNVDPRIYYCLSEDNIKEITNYISEDKTATTFSNLEKSGKKEVVTSELIYYWMIACGIPFECQKWHLSRLLALIRICQIKSNSGKKMSKSDIYKQNSKLNAQRRKINSSKG